MYEFINLTCFSGLVAAAVVLRRPQYRALWVFVLVPVLILLTVSGRWLYTNAAPVMPALQSYWLPIHVSVVSLGSGVFLVAGVASILFLVKMSRLRAGRRGRPGPHRGAAARRPDAGPHRLPHNDFRVPGVRLRRHLRRDLGRGGLGPLLGLGPRETVSFIAWVIYAAYLHARSTAGWRDKKAAWINVAGFAMVFNLFFINLVTVGLHSAWGRLTRVVRPELSMRGISRCLTNRRLSVATAVHRSGEFDAAGMDRPDTAQRVAGRRHPPRRASGPRAHAPPDLSTAALLGQPSGAVAGWRKWLYLASFKLINLGESPKVVRHNNLVAQVNRPLSGCYRIALLSLKGGVGKTTITATLGATFASIRGDRVVAVDANPDRGTLSQKVPLETPATVRHLLRDAEGIERYSDVRSYTSQGPSRLEVLASRATRRCRRRSAPTTTPAPRCWSGSTAWCSPTAARADALGDVGGAGQGRRADRSAPDRSTVPAARRRRLDWLDAHGHEDMEELDRGDQRGAASVKVDMQKVVDHFSRRCRACWCRSTRIWRRAPRSAWTAMPETREALDRIGGRGRRRLSGQQQSNDLIVGRRRLPRLSPWPSRRRKSGSSSGRSCASSGWPRRNRSRQPT